MWPEPGSWGLRTCPPHWPQSAERWVQARTHWRLQALLGLSTQGWDHYHLQQPEQQSDVCLPFNLHTFHLFYFLTIHSGLEFVFCVPTQLDLHEWASNTAARLRKVSGSNNLQEGIPVKSPIMWQCWLTVTKFLLTLNSIYFIETCWHRCVCYC